MLDQIPENALPRPKGLTRLQSIARGIEIAAFMVWVYGLLGLKLSWPLSSQLWGFATLILTILYLFLPYFILGAKGWFQGILSHFAGLIFIGAFLAFLFKLESWEAADTLWLVAGLIGGAFCLGSVYMLVFKSLREEQKAFWWMILVRMGIVVLGAGYFIVLW